MVEHGGVDVPGLPVRHRSHPRRASDDSGMALLFMAISLVAMLGFSTFAVDLGGLYNARRQDQSAADTAALGGAQDLTRDDATIVAQVRSLIESTLGLAPGTLDLNSCAGVIDADSVDIPLTGANCISRNAGRSQLQVRLPVQQYASIVGGVVGVDSFDHSAFAIAGRTRVGFGGPLPFAMASGAGGGDGYICIKSGTGGHSSRPCDGASSGNFGYIDLAFFGDPALGTVLECGGNAKNRIKNNIAVGADHDFSIYGDPTDWGSTTVLDTALPCGSVARPNSMSTLTGNVPEEMGEGMYAGGAGLFTDGKPARLQREDSRLFNFDGQADGDGEMRLVAGQMLDDNPLWEFIDPTGPDVPSSCQSDQFTVPSASLPDGVANHLKDLPLKDRMRKLLQRCITHYNGLAWGDEGALEPAEVSVGCSLPCEDAVFGLNSWHNESPDLYDIQYTSRFAYIPELTGAFPGGTSADVHIAGFRAIFIQRLLIDCNGNTCDYDFEPGVGYNSPSGSPNRADSVTAFAFPDTMLPNDLASGNAPSAIGKNRTIRLLR